MRIRPLKRVTNATRQRAQELRRDMTGPERRLWSVLERKKLGGLKFRRQHPIEPFIADFYCAEKGLVVELDGMSHVGRGEEDEKRTAHFESIGLKVIRVTNDDVMQNLEAVAEFILRESASNSPPLKEAAGGGIVLRSGVRPNAKQSQNPPLTPP
jgi:very-short-patch-repair endonuclease